MKKGLAKLWVGVVFLVGGFFYVLNAVLSEVFSSSNHNTDGSSHHDFDDSPEGLNGSHVDLRDAPSGYLDD